MLIKSRFGSEFREYEIGDIVKLATAQALTLSSGVQIENFNLAFQTYGKLNADKSNAILICHALTGDQYLAGIHPVTKKKGWWDFMIGAGKAIDTDKYFVICSNVIGGCLGSFGPKEINPATGKIYGINFPVITIADMVGAQKLLIDHLGIKFLLSVIGGSMGGMQVLTWAALYGEYVKSAIPISTSYKHSAQNIAFNEVGRQAIMADPNWCAGNYLAQKKYPSKGLAVARMAAHITYLSEDALHNKFGRCLQDKENLSYGFEVDFQIESYLRHQGFTFVERFDANSYLYITKAMDYFDLEAENKGILSNAFRNIETRFCVISFSDDWLFPSDESKKLARALNIAGANTSFINIAGNAGHDGFLIENQILKDTISGFLRAISREGI